MSRIAVTGGAGFIGSAVMRRLDELGYDSVSIDRREGLDILNDQQEVEEELQFCDGVIHLAGILGTAELFDQVEEAIDTNIKGSAAILKMAVKHDLSYVGITMPRVWDNVYQATKAASVTLASAYHRHFDLHVSHVRAYNVFGPGQKVGIPQKIVPTFAHCAWTDRPIPVWGDGTQLVDLVYVGDVASMLVDALEFGGNDYFDAGTGTPMSVNDVARYTLDCVPESLSKMEYLPMRKGEHGSGVMAIGEGWDKLGWHPKLELEALKATIESYKVR